jgi:hypothetical protein
VEVLLYVLRKSRILALLLDSKMTFLSHIEAVISKSSRIFGLIKRVLRKFSDPYTYNVLYVSLVRPNLAYAANVWSPH